jgi:hypothetical protein
MRLIRIYCVVCFLLLIAFPLTAQEKVFDCQMIEASYSSQDEFAPAFYKRGIVYVSDTRLSQMATYTNNADMPRMLYHYFFIKRQDEGYERTGVPFAQEIGGINDKGSLVFGQGGKRMYFTKSVENGIPLKNTRRQLLNGIFIANQVGGKWKDIQPFPYNPTDADNFNVGHPAITANETRLFFASDRKGGQGNSDIWYSDFIDSAWAEPVNLGPLVNTTGKEFFPFWHQATGRLYFASTGHGSTGNGRRLDIFYTWEMNGIWQEPVQLPPPFNTKFDDYGFVADSSLENGFLSSDRNRFSSKEDIFRFSVIAPVFKTANPIREPELCKVFYDANATLLDTTIMLYEWDFGDGTKLRATEAPHCYTKPGLYDVKLNVIDLQTGELYFNLATYQYEVEDIRQVRIKAPESCNPGQKIELSAEAAGLKDFEIDDYYWEFGDMDRANGAIVKHSFMLPGSYMVKCGVVGKDKEGKEAKVCSYIMIEVKDATLVR